MGAIGLTVSIAGIASAINDCVSLASEVEEMENKFNVVFGNISEDVDAWAQSYADAIGRNKNDIKTYLADQQNLLVGFGMTREAGAELSKQMTTLALDLASFGNLDESYAIENMTKAIMGESEAAKGLGAVLNDATREQAMMTLGLTGTYESLDQVTKMQVNYQAILSQSADAVGDCERSMGSYASTLRGFQSRLKELKQLIGQFFMPVFQKVLSFGTRGISMLRNIVQRINDFAVKVGGAEKILGVLAVTLAATFAVLKGKAIFNAVKGFSSLAKAMGMAGAKAMLVFGLILILVLLIQDFVAFMKGDNSLIGTIFDKAGIGADNARQTILNAWNIIKDFLLNVWNVIKSAAQTIFGALSDWVGRERRERHAVPPDYLGGHQNASRNAVERAVVRSANNLQCAICVLGAMGRDHHCCIRRNLEHAHLSHPAVPECDCRNHRLPCERVYRQLAGSVGSD